MPVTVQIRLEGFASDIYRAGLGVERDNLNSDEPRPAMGHGSLSRAPRRWVHMWVHTCLGTKPEMRDMGSVVSYPVSPNGFRGRVMSGGASGCLLEIEWRFRKGTRFFLFLLPPPRSVPHPRRGQRRRRDTPLFWRWLREGETTPHLSSLSAFHPMSVATSIDTSRSMFLCHMYVSRTILKLS